MYINSKANTCSISRFLNIISSESYNQNEVDVIMKKSRFLHIFDSCNSCYSSDDFDQAIATVLNLIEDKLDLKTNYLVKSHYTQEEYNTTIGFIESIFAYCSYCPPTEIGPALELLKNTIFGIEIKEELSERAVTKLHDSYFESLKENISKLEESKRYSNWYHGYTYLEFPHWDDSLGLYYNIYTTATSGSITTENFFDFFIDDFDRLKKNFEEHLYYMINIDTPWANAYDPDTTLYMTIRKVSSRSSGGNSEERMSFQWSSINEENDFDCENFKDEILFNFTEPEYYHSMSLERQIDTKELKKSNCMPGFHVDWHYNVDLEAENYFSHDCENEAFRQ